MNSITWKMRHALNFNTLKIISKITHSETFLFISVSQTASRFSSMNINKIQKREQRALRADQSIKQFLTQVK